MATKPLKSLKFPTLDDTYTVPQVDDTLAVQGAAAEAKKVGDELTDIKEDLNKEYLLSTHKIGIVDYHSLNYQQFDNWESPTSSLEIQSDGSLKGTVNNGYTRSILTLYGNWGIPKTNEIAIRLRAKFSKSISATLVLRLDANMWAWSTAVSFTANEEKEVVYVVTNALQNINGFSLQTANDSLTAGDTCIVYKCDIVNLDISPWDDATEFGAACWNSDNRINDPYEILRMDNIPSSTFTYQNVNGVVTIINELNCLGFKANTRTDVITDDGTEVTEIRTLTTPPCGMTIVTNKTTKRGRVITDGI